MATITAAMIAERHRLALPSGYQLGKYRFSEVLRAGGFGITYLAKDHNAPSHAGEILRHVFGF